MRISEGVYYEFDDVSIRPKRSEDIVSRKDVSLVRDFKTRWHKERILKGVPLIVSNMYHVGTFAMAKALEQFGCSVALDKSYTVEEVLEFEEFGSENHWYSLGESLSDLKTLEGYAIKTDLPLKINIEVANAHRQKYVDVVKAARAKFPNAIIMGGDVASPSMTEELIREGLDIVRVGIGPGSVCITRKVTGVGVPQFSLIHECQDAAHQVGGLVCSDGGAKTSGDLVKAYGAGADFIMSGNLFAGHDECRGEKRTQDGKISHMKYFGSASQAALNMRGIDNSYRPAEGKEVWVEYKGPVEKTAKQLLGGIRSAMTFLGAKELRELSLRCEFVRLK